MLVHAEHRGTGIGTALLERTLREARSKFEVVYLSAFSDNDGAKRLYRKFGFSVCGLLPRSVKRAGRYYDEERMALVLANEPSPTQANR